MKTFPTPPDGFDGEALVRAMSPAIGLPVAAAEIPEIAMNLSRTAAFANLIIGQADLDRVESAQVFNAEGRRR